MACLVPPIPDSKSSMAKPNGGPLISSGRAPAGAICQSMGTSPAGRSSGLQRQAEGVALGQGPEQHLPPQTGRSDAAQGHQAVGQAVVVDLNAGQRLPRFR